MKSHLMFSMLLLVAAGRVFAQAAPGAVMWAANPSGQQPMPNAPALTLLPLGGAVPLRTGDGGKCLLVARRGPQIVAVELSPLVIGPKLVGWTPKVIDMNTLTSKWGYAPPKPSEQPAFGNPVTNAIAATSKSGEKPSAYSGSSAWSNTNVDAHRESARQGASAGTVTVNVKTYRKYSQFEAASTDVPGTASDEYFCQ